MEKLVMLRSLHRSICRRSFAFAAPATAVNHQSVRRYFPASPASIFSSPNHLPSSSLSPSAMGVGITRSFSQELTHLPDIKDPQIENAIKDLMAASWDELPDSLIYSVKKALSLNTEDKAGQEALANVFHAAEAVEEFGGTLVTLKMELDDSVGMGGEDVKPLSNELVNALRVAYERYTTYLDAFGPDEVYLRKKVENELGIKMIHLKMRCGGLGSEWGKVTVLGTSGLSGSYVEQRA